MFAVYCPRHQHRVLLGARSIKALVNTPDGILVRWQCRCGAEGTVRTGQPPAVTHHDVHPPFEAQRCA
jgi:hypothetical protein